MTIRPAGQADSDAILALIEQPTSVDFVTPESYRDRAAAGSYRDEWTWVVEDHGRIQAVALWWGPPDHDHACSLDGLYFAGEGDPVPHWTALIRHAVATWPPGAEPPEYHLFLDSAWRDDSQTVAELDGRSRAAAAAGLTGTTDRLRFEWCPSDGLPARSGRLRFEAADNDAFVDVFVRVAQGSLDAATAREIARVGPVDAARGDLEMYTSMQGDRSWWRLAYSGDPELVGFAIPSANQSGPVVGYLGVVPEHRGRGYVDDLLAEITHLLSEAGAERIRADTDATNVPMASSFERLGYRQFAIRRVLSIPR